VQTLTLIDNVSNPEVCQYKDPLYISHHKHHSEKDTARLKDEIKFLYKKKEKN